MERSVSAFTGPYILWVQPPVKVRPTFPFPHILLLISPPVPCHPTYASSSSIWLTPAIGLVLMNWLTPADDWFLWIDWHLLLDWLLLNWLTPAIGLVLMNWLTLAGMTGRSLSFTILTPHSFTVILSLISLRERMNGETMGENESEWVNVIKLRERNPTLVWDRSTAVGFVLSLMVRSVLLRLVSFIPFTQLTLTNTSPNNKDGTQ